MTKKYFVKHKTENKIVMVVEGEEGYYPLAYDISESQADKINLSLGHTPAEVEAASMASMFGWDKFDNIVEHFGG